MDHSLNLLYLILKTIPFQTKVLKKQPEYSKTHSQESNLSPSRAFFLLLLDNADLSGYAIPLASVSKKKGYGFRIEIWQVCRLYIYLSRFFYVFVFSSFDGVRSAERRGGIHFHSKGNIVFYSSQEARIKRSFRVPCEECRRQRKCRK
ncbi:hypothetical protein CDAR_498691 [Caerostris darwini]|uniref:Uncharacterized protein n=1 Tax=Caerostris darwini TaxID=1538125 RepID=A0AAV4SMB6_9ARAC|nr:hypothetical protein CDAR_498691 [Caerostris darwini]